MIRLVLMFTAWLVVGAAFAADPAPAVGEDPLERQVLEIAAELRCTVCQNQPVSESNSDLALDMRAIIREQVIAGKTRDEIVGYFVERYGDYVLLKPRRSGAGLIVWAVPAAVFALLVISAALFLRKRSHVVAPPPPELSAEDAERVARARAGDRQA